MTMMIKSIRRITNDARHNAFTGACWFKGNLYVAYRQGDAHVCPHGRIVVLRSRDQGISWDHVAVLRGPGDTRDAHLYTDGTRLYMVSFVADIDAGRAIGSGCGSTEDGDCWTPWTPYKGTGTYVMWRPEYFQGKHYCAGYVGEDPYGVHWFESGDGILWRDVKTLYESKDEEPNECALEILPDGAATMLMRCDGKGKHPYLYRGHYPFKEWNVQKLDDISLTGPAVWTVDGNIYIGCRWHMTGSDMRDEGCSATHTAIFKVVEGKARLQCVLPSGPRPDHSYMGIARWPDNQHRFAISFYSNAIAPDDPALVQWSKPDIYLADILFGAEVLEEFLVSDLVETANGLKDARVPDPDKGGLKYQTVRIGDVPNFINVKDMIAQRSGLIYFVKDIEIGPWDEIRLLLGYDGPVKVWMNGVEVFAGPGNNPASEDKTSLRVKTRHGCNRLAIALDTNKGKAWGIFARWERV